MREFYDVLSGITAKPVLNIQRFDRAGDSNHYHVVFSSAQVNKEYSQVDYDDVIASMTEGKLRIKRDSLYPVESNIQTPLFRCILETVATSIDYNEKSVAESKLVPIQANVFADENDGIWKLVGNEGAQRLVQVTEDNYDELLEAKRVRNPIVASFDYVVPVSEGDYVYFLNEASGEMDFGFAVSIKGRDRIFSKASGTLLDPSEFSVVCACEVGHIPGSPKQKKIEMLAASEFDLNTFLDYMRSLYGGHEMMRELEKAIRGHGVR